MYPRHLLCIQGLIFLVPQLEEIFVLTEKISGCDVEKSSKGTMVANCLAKGINSIPQNLGSEIQVLDISYNNISVLNQDDLKVYPELWALYMRNLSVTSFPAEYFKHTAKLKMLNISNTQISNLNEIPVSVTLINFTYCRFDYVDLSHLSKLEYLYMGNSSSLKKVPALSRVAPLKKLHLKYSPLTEANYSQIAPFCLLKYFGLNSAQLAADQYVYQCCGLRKWARYYNLSGYNNQQCSRNQTHYPKCSYLNITFDEESVKLFNTCYYAVGLAKFILLLAAFIICLILIGIGVCASTLYYNYKFKVTKKLRNSSGLTETETEEESDENSDD